MKYAIAGAALLAVLYFTVILQRKKGSPPDGSYSYPPPPAVVGYSNPTSTGAIVNAGTSVVASLLGGPFGARGASQALGYTNPTDAPPVSPPPGSPPVISPGGYSFPPEPVAVVPAYAPPALPPPTTDNINTIDHAEAMPPLSFPPILRRDAPPIIVQPSTGPKYQARSGRGAF